MIKSSTKGGWKGGKPRNIGIIGNINLTWGALAHAVKIESNEVAWSQSVSESINATYMVG